MLRQRGDARSGVRGRGRDAALPLGIPERPIVRIIREALVHCKSSAQQRGMQHAWCAALEDCQDDREDAQKTWPSRKRGDFSSPRHAASKPCTRAWVMSASKLSIATKRRMLDPWCPADRPSSWRAGRQGEQKTCRNGWLGRVRAAPHRRGGDAACDAPTVPHLNHVFC